MDTCYTVAPKALSVAVPPNAGGGEYALKHVNSLTRRRIPTRCSVGGE